MKRYVLYVFEPAKSGWNLMETTNKSHRNLNHYQPTWWIVVAQMIEGILETPNNGTQEKRSEIAVQLHCNFMTFQWSTSEEKATHPCEVCKGKTDKTAALRSRDWSHNITTIFGQQHQQVPSKSRQTLHNRALQEHVINTSHHFTINPPLSQTPHHPHPNLFIRCYRPLSASW